MVLIIATTLLLGTNVFSTADQAANLDSSPSQIQLADAPVIKQEETIPAVEQKKLAPVSLSAVVVDGSEITSYKEFDTGITQNAIVSFFDPLFSGKDDKPSSHGGDHRVYKKQNMQLIN